MPSVWERSRNDARGRCLIVAAAAAWLLGLALPIGAAAGGFVSSLSVPILPVFYGFGLIALLYLVTEELLAET